LVSRPRACDPRCRRPRPAEGLGQALRAEVRHGDRPSCAGPDRRVGGRAAVTPDVSVVIATRDRWELLSTHALPAALAQEDVLVEVIVVDDASRDETATRLRELE